MKKNRQRADQIEKEIEELEKKKREEIARIDAEIAKKQNIIKTISKSLLFAFQNPLKSFCNMQYKFRKRLEFRKVD